VAFSHESEIAFLVPDYCRETVRNSVSAGSGLSLDIFTLQDIHHMPALSIKMQSICTAAKQCRRNHCFTMMFLKLLQMHLHFFRIRVMVLNSTSNNIAIISWQSVLLAEETESSNKSNDLSKFTVKLYFIRLYRIYLVIGGIQTHNYSDYQHCKPNYHTITTTTTPYIFPYCSYIVYLITWESIAYSKPCL